jgi:PAS domain S-box-containing protein
MKDKDKSSQKKSTGSKGAQNAKRTGSSSSTRRSSMDISAVRSAQIEARFRAVFENSRDAIGVSKAGVHIFVNPAYLDLFGYPRGTDLAGKPVLDLIAPDNRDHIKAYIQRRVRGESVPSIYETRGLHADGSIFDMEVSVSSYQENSEDHTLVMLRDLTARKRAEEEIAERGAMLRQIMDTASVAIGLVDKTGRITHANQRMAEMFGWKLDELIGCEYVELIHPSERETGRRNMLDLLASKIPSVDLERLYWRKDGTEFWGHLACRRFHDVHGSELGLIGVITDISMRKRSDLALMQSEEKYRRFYNETPVMLHSIDRQGIVVDVNDYWLTTMGYERSEVIGRKVTDYFSSASRKYAQDVIQPAFFRDGSVRDIELQFIKKNGEVMDVLLSATSERDVAGTLVRSQAVIEDVTERKRMEEKLRRSEERYRDLFENAIDPIVIVDDKQNYLDVNKRAMELFGYSREEFLSMNIRDIIPSEQLPRSENAFSELARQGTYQQFIGKVQKKDGTFVDIEVSSSAIMENSRIIGSRDIIRDITERKRAEDERRRSERLLQTIIDAEPECVKLLDENANLIMMNRAGLDMIQADSLDQVKGQCICPMITSEHSQAFMDLTRRVFQGESGTLLFEIIGLKGRHLWLDTHAVPLRNEKDEIIALLGVTRDISEQKRIEEALRENQARLDLALQSAHMGVWRYEIKENRRYFDNLTCQLLGIDAATFTGTAEEFFRVVHPEDREMLKAAITRTIEQDAPYEPAYRVTWPEGSVHYIAARGRLVRDDKGQPARINGILWDMTDQRLLEEERLKTQKLESIGTLAGGIAHDFNNLLQGIFGFISMARLTIEQKEKALSMLAQAEKALHQSVNLTSQLLTFSKGGTPVKKVMHLRPVIENSSAFALSGSRVTCKIVADTDLRTVEADEGQIGQVIQNIVLNADQSMPLGGRILISVRNMPAAAILSPTEMKGELVEISISDQGTGISAEHLTRIFDPYFTTKEKGSGLGLASAYSIIKNHGGLMRVQSEIGKGTTFFIYLPASGAAVEEPRGPAIPAQTRRARVLVMDDEEMIRLVATELLTAIGHEVVCAETGESALEAYQAAQDTGTPFDLVILDLTIRGGMGGIETMRKLAEIDPAVRAIVSSGYSDDAALSNYRVQGFQAFLKKPYNQEELQRALQALLA